MKKSNIVSYSGINTTKKEQEKNNHGLKWTKMIGNCASQEMVKTDCSLWGKNPSSFLKS